MIERFPAAVWTADRRPDSGVGIDGRIDERFAPFISVDNVHSPVPLDADDVFSNPAPRLRIASWLGEGF